MRRALRAAPRARAVLLGPLPGGVEPPPCGRHPGRRQRAGLVHQRDAGDHRPALPGQWLGPGRRLRRDQRGRLAGNYRRRRPDPVPPETYSRVLARLDPGQRRITEDTFAGLRFVRNQMGYHTHPADFIQPLDRGPGIAAWTWKPVPEPAFAALPPRGRDWEITRYQAYQAQLAGRAIGEIFTQATAFLDIAADSILSRT